MFGWVRFKPSLCSNRLYAVFDILYLKFLNNKTETLHVFTKVKN